MNIDALTDPDLSDVKATAIDSGTASDEDETVSLQASRLIDLNSDIILPIAEDPRLIIDENGSIVEQQAVTIGSDPSDSFILLDRIVNDGTLGGEINLLTNKSNRDGQMTDPRVITGSPDVTFQTGYSEVVIRNESEKPLLLRDIQAVNPAATASDIITISGSPDQSEFAPTETTDPGATEIIIESGGAIGLGGLIANPYGSTSLTSSEDISQARLGGSLSVAFADELNDETISTEFIDALSAIVGGLANPTVSAEVTDSRWTITTETRSWILYHAEGSNQIHIYPGFTNRSQRAIQSSELHLNSGDDVGFNNLPLPIYAGNDGLTTLSGSAADNFYVRMLDGDVAIGSIATGSQLTLLADGSLVDAATDNDGVDLSASQLNLTTFFSADDSVAPEDRTVGTTANPLELSISGLININAGGNIAVSEAGQTFDVGTIGSAYGDIELSVLDRDDVGQNLVISTDSLLGALRGAVTLNVGDNLEHDGSLIAEGDITINADLAGTDIGTGASIGLRGFLKSFGTIEITTGTDADEVSLQQLNSNSDVIISTGAGADLIEVGTQDGLLNVIPASLQIDAGEEADPADDLLVRDRIVLDDSNRVAAQPVRVVQNTSSLGFDTQLAHQDQKIHYSNAESVLLTLGAGNDSVTINQTVAGTELEIDLGEGNDAAAIGSGLGTLANIQGGVSFEASAGTDSLSIDNSGTSANSTGLLGSSNLTGFGLGGNLGFGGFEQVELSLGSGNDDLEVTGTRAEVNVELGGGDDNLSITGQLFGFKDHLNLSGTTIGDTGANSGDDTLTLNLPAASTFTIDKTSIINPAGGGNLNYEQLAAINATLSAGSDNVEIVDVGVSLNLDTGGGSDDVTVRNISVASTIDLGEDAVEDQLTVLGVAANLAATGDAGGIDTLTVDRSETTAAVTSGRLDDTASGVLSGVTSGDVTFDEIANFELLLGTGNDDFVIGAGDGLAGVNLVIDGGDSTDTIDVVELSGPTAVRGGDGEDTVNVFIDGFPTAGQFTDLGLTIESLAIHNSGSDVNTQWSLVDASLTAESATSGGPITVIDDILRVDRVNFFAGSGDNSLNIGTETVNDVVGFVDDEGRIRTRAQVNFNGVVAGQSTYAEDGFNFAAGTGESFAVNGGSVVVAGGGTIAMSDASGEPFDLLRFSIQSATAQTITATGISAVDGSTVIETFQANGGNANQIISLEGMRDVSSVEFDLQNGTRLAEIVGSAQLSNTGRVDLNFGSIELNPGQATTFSQAPNGGRLYAGSRRREHLRRRRAFHHESWRLGDRPGDSIFAGRFHRCVRCDAGGT